MCLSRFDLWFQWESWVLMLISVGVIMAIKGPYRVLINWLMSGWFSFSMFLNVMTCTKCQELVFQGDKIPSKSQIPDWFLGFCLELVSFLWWGNLQWDSSVFNIPTCRCWILDQTNSDFYVYLYVVNNNSLLLQWYTQLMKSLPETFICLIKTI